MPRPPWPLIEISLAPTSKDDRSNLRGALLEMVAENPDLDFSTASASDQFVLKAMTEACLGVAIERLRSGPVAFVTGQTQAAYRERLTRRRELDYTHKRSVGGHGQFARVTLRFEPNEPGAGYAFAPKVAESILPEAYFRGIEKGLASVLPAGVLAGYPVVDVEVALIDGAYHAVDSSPLAFEIAARAAFREALQDSSVLTEPVMAVEVTVPDPHAARIVGDLQARRGLIRDRSLRGPVGIVTATVPLAEMLGYGSYLSSLAGEDARATMDFSHYAPVPSLDLDPPPVLTAMRA